MHFERLHATPSGRDILEVLVGDEVFTGAQVDLKGLTRPDRIWFFEQLTEAVAAWTGESAPPGALKIEGSALEHRLEVDHGQGWTQAPALSQLDPEARRRIQETLDALLATLNPLLLIY